MVDVTVEQSAGIWVAVITAMVTTLATLYALYREWQRRRQERVERLAKLAMLAVRRTESAYVRPLLCARIWTCLDRFVHERCVDPLRLRLRLFCEMQQTVGLTDDEKRIAQTTAINHLVALLRSTPSPPLHAHTDEDVALHEPHLREQVETAYSLRPRLAGVLVRQAGQFAGLLLRDDDD